MAANNLKRDSNNASLKKLCIFAASSSDVASERAKIDTVVDLLKPLAESVGLMLDVMNWGKVVPDAGRPQQVILDQIKPTKWDLFIGILWHRFGTPSGGINPKTQMEFMSGTEEEFVTAYNLWREYKRPRIMLYRCSRDVKLDVIDPDQYKRVKNFFRKVEGVKDNYPLLYQTFDTTDAFEKLLFSNLQQILLDYNDQVHGKPLSSETVQILVKQIPDNLPRRDEFFGRTQEIEIIMRVLNPNDRTWGVLVDGIGGIGKTALAVEVAYRAQEAGAFEAYVFVSAKETTLEPCGIREKTPSARTFDEFLNETARVLRQIGITKLSSSDEKRRALIDALRTMRALLIYDNPETLSKKEKEEMTNFLRELPQGCKAIITSRWRGGEGAVWLRLEKLDWDAAYGIIENEIVRDAGLSKKLRRVKSRWQELYDETNGSPLALVYTLGLMRVRATLTFDGALEMLRGNRNADLQEFIFQEARKELTENDKTALSALSFFILSATFEAWMQVANLSHSALEMAIDRLDLLSLLAKLDGQERYALNSVVQNFVRVELLSQDVQTECEMGIRFAKYWVDYAKRFGGSSRKYKTFDQLDIEWKNLYAAAKWLWKKAAVRGDGFGDKDSARQLNDLVRALRQFLLFYGFWNERLELCDWAYDANSALNDWSSAGWRAYDMAWIHLSRGQIDKAMFWTDHCSSAWRLGGNKSEQTIIKRLNGLLAQQSEDYVTAEELYLEALDIWSELKNEEWKALVLDSLGELAREQKLYEKADKHYREALALAEKLDNKYLQANIAGNLGQLLLDCEGWEEARKWYEKENQCAKEIGCQSLITESQYGRACVYEAEGQVDLALQLAQEAQKIYERLQHAKLAKTWELVERLTTALNKKQN
jgi:tetratricopeptide (TPR) repeat protein